MVQQVDSLGDARVLVKHHLWWFNSECLSLKTEKSDEETEESIPGRVGSLDHLSYGKREG